MENSQAEFRTIKGYTRDYSSHHAGPVAGDLKTYTKATDGTNMHQHRNHKTS